MVECIFGWGKQHGTMRKTKHRGIARVAADFLLKLIAYNLICIPKLLALSHHASGCTPHQAKKYIQFHHDTPTTTGQNKKRSTSRFFRRLLKRFRANGSRECAPDDRLRGYRFA